MKNLLIIILFTVLLGGCTVNFGKTKPEPEKKPEGEIIYTANGPMLKLPDGSMVAVQD